MSGVCKTAEVAFSCKNEGKIQSPLLYYLYQTRSQVVHSAVQQLIVKIAESGPRPQLLILGAGLDTLFETKEFYETNLSTIFAVDLPPIIAQRKEMIPSTKSINLSCDLNAPTLSTHLPSLLKENNFCFSTPTIVVLEMVMGYLQEDAVLTRLMPLIGSLHAYVVSYDVVVDASTVLGKSLITQFNKRQAPLLCLRPNRAAHLELFASSGIRGQCYSMARALKLVNTITDTTTTTSRSSSSSSSSSSRSRSTIRAPPEYFDEHASLAVLQEVYSLTIAASPSILAVSLTEALSRNTQVLIQPATQAHVSDITSLYKRAFSQYADRYSAVRKFIKTAVRQLSSIGSCGDDCIDKSLLGLCIEHRRGSCGGIWHSGAFFVALSHEQVVGCFGVKVLSLSGRDGVVEASHLAVDECHRRRGIGQALLDALLCHVKSMSPRISTIELSVLSDLTAALALYKRNGFTRCRETNCSGGCVIIHMEHRLQY